MTEEKILLRTSNFFSEVPRVSKMLTLKKDLESGQLLDEEKRLHAVPSSILLTEGQAGSTELGNNPEKSVQSYQTWTF